MKIILDTMGGDNAPDANIKGAINAINKVKAEISVIKYEEFFKIKEIKYGFLFYIQRYKCFLFEYSEIQGDMENLKKILFNNKGSKK